MRRLALLLAILAAPAVAQQDPRITAQISAPETVVGQPLILRIRVLVPGYMPAPPVFPDFEMPGLLIRLPEGGSTPVSERVGSDTWSGVQRSYRIYPLEPGQFTLPAAQVQITYTEGGPNDARTTTAPLPDIAMAATVPAAARDLSPLIVARGFTLEETLEIPEDLAVGGAATREVTARIEGTTPILIPPLSTGTPEGLRVYADEPDVTETEDRGTLSGSRSERIVYLPETEGQAVLPALGFDWYDLDSGTVQRAELPAHEIAVAPGPEPARLPPDPRRIALAVGGVMALLAVLLLAWRLALPPARRMVRRRRARRLASESHACRQVRAALAARDLTALNRALALWRGRVPAGLSLAPMDAALAGIGAARYGTAPGSDDRAWRDAAAVFDSLRRTARAPGAGTGAGTGALPALNP